MKFSYIYSLVILSASVCLGEISTQSQKYGAKDSYAIVISSNSYGQTEWRKVANYLQEKYNGSVIIYPNDIYQTLATLSKISPKYSCFVAQQAEANREYIVKINRMTRALDSDPYGDTIWGVVTGNSAQDAMKLVESCEALTIEKGFSGTSGIGLDAFKEGVQFNEGQAGGYCRKMADGSQTNIASAVDSTKDIVTFINRFKPDVIYTSGHGFENGWQIGYNYKDGYLKSRHNQLYGIDMAGKEYSLKSPNTKVYLPIGNCLIGNIIDSNSFALAMMREGGVRQMFGYTAVTFFGYMGWGIDTYFSTLRNYYSFSQSFYCNNQALIYKLRKEFPEDAEGTIKEYDYRKAAKVTIARGAHNMLWDLDAVAFYGDPAWEARYPSQPASWDYKLEHSKNKIKFRLETLDEGQWPNRPLIFFLTKEIDSYEIVGGSITNAEIADNFIILPKEGAFDKGEVQTLELEVKNRDKRNISDNEHAIIVGEELYDLNMIPLKYQSRINRVIERSGNKAIIEILKEAPVTMVSNASFLIAYMPQRDLKRLEKKAFLKALKQNMDTVASNYWQTEIPSAIIQNYILPNHVITEKRSQWRLENRAELLDKVKGCKTLSEVALKLNQRIWQDYKVRYSTQRKRADQSPKETIESGLASCTGLSILLVESCRAVGVPVRIVIIPRWYDDSGNHSWVEIWDKGWHYLGASESSGLDEGWFAGKASKSLKGQALYSIYGISYEDQGTILPYSFGTNDFSINAVNITDRYAQKYRGDKHKIELKIVCKESTNGRRIKTYITLKQGKKIVGQGQSRGPENDMNDILTFQVRGGQSYQLLYTNNSQRIEKEIAIKKDPKIQIEELELQ